MVVQASGEGGKQRGASCCSAFAAHRPATWGAAARPRRWSQRLLIRALLDAMLYGCRQTLLTHSYMCALVTAGPLDAAPPQPQPPQPQQQQQQQQQQPPSPPQLRPLTDPVQTVIAGGRLPSRRRCSAAELI